MLTVVIQAGGESRRMGRDKALIPFLDKPLIMHVYDAVKFLADEVLITTNHPENYRFMEVPLYPDIVKERGALGGIFTALKSAHNPVVAIVACDMPFASSELLSRASDRLVVEQVDAVVPRTGDGLEPLHAVYRRKTCIPAVKRALETGEWKVTSWFSKVNIAFMESEELMIYDPEKIAFWNVNTVEDLERAQDFALRGMK
jgi:molybdopterin-guanine dinucleotide biosynthesis protein A